MEEEPELITIESYRDALEADLAKTRLDSAGITPRISRSSRLFTEALAFYDQRHYSAALKKFEAVQHLNSHYPGIYGYIAECRDKIKKGIGRETGATEHMLLIASVLLLLAGGVVALKLLRPTRVRA